MVARYIFITGGVVSSLGKGLSAAALGALLQKHGYKVRLRKLDPYLNVDPGTMSPFEHGEVFVTDDGSETDLDLGHYERFTDVTANCQDNITTGRIYQRLIAQERSGKVYDGKTVQVIPHVTDEIKKFIADHTEEEEFILCEIGGTVGDIESLPFLEAIRQFGNEVGKERTLFIHVTLLPFLRSSGELKTKPTQHSVKELLSVGIQPDILLCRSEMPIPEEQLAKIARFCNIDRHSVIQAIDLETIYEAPLAYEREGLDRSVLIHFSLQSEKLNNLDQWHSIVRWLKYPEGEVSIAIVGKYNGLTDAYKSLIEALTHGGIDNKVKVTIRWIEAEDLESPSSQIQDFFVGCQGILVPGGFGGRGVEGKIAAAGFARTQKIPYFGICYGMQMALLEAARHLANIPDAVSYEFSNKEGTPIITHMTEWQRGHFKEIRSLKQKLGGTMRLGSYPCVLKKGSRVAKIYNKTNIEERHRHRFEVDIAYKETLEEAGIIFSGMSPDGTLPEIIEIADHPWFLGVQFHPELKSRPFAPHPLFSSFVKAALAQSRLV